MFRGVLVAFAVAFLIASSSPGLPGPLAQAAPDAQASAATALTPDLAGLARIVEEASLLVEAGADPQLAMQRVVRDEALLFDQGTLWLGLSPEDIEAMCDSPDAFHGAISIISGAWVNACNPAEAFTNAFLPLIGVWIPTDLNAAVDFDVARSGYDLAGPSALWASVASLGLTGAAFGQAIASGHPVAASIEGIYPGVLLAHGGTHFTGSSFSAFLQGDTSYVFSGPASLAASPACLGACMAGWGGDADFAGLASDGFFDPAALPMVPGGPHSGEAVVVISRTGLGLVGDPAAGQAFLDAVP